ncbi:hypothetical protein BJY01DRAFT_258208 [Aspergillus pseudoustus]|uniref:F-box domain-containing protein n=1 Tax=Aspergillus pseudoustus TaxID=1810923 RepID=A0ABR4JD23_9EURO
MGTRGLFFIRWKGRYYAYYNHYDSYPEGLGEAIVEKIPATPEEYQEWLENMRQTYNHMSNHFEEQILPVCTEFLQPGGIPTREGRFSRSYLAVDDRLQERPTWDMKNWTGHLFIEWTYTIDLDRELLGVDQSAFFPLAKLPHYVDWHKYLKLDGLHRRIIASDTPADLISNLSKDAGIEIGLNDDLRARYNSFDLTIGLPKNMRENDTRNASRVTLLVATIEAICRAYRDLLDLSYLDWVSTSFPFREIAFAITSAAAGEIAFESPQSLDRRYSLEGFFRIPGNDFINDEHTLLPKFLSECHIPGVRPGSAPESNPFWAGNVLVYLTPRLDLVEVEEASIAAVVDFGLGQGRKSFHAMVFAILDFVLIDVTEGNGRIQIRRTPLTNLIYFDDDTSRFSKGPRSRGAKPTSSKTTAQDDEGEMEESDDGSNVTATLDTESHKAQAGNVGGEMAALLLIYFFDSAMDEHLQGSKSQVFPNEILSTIMEFSDHQTYLSLAKASACCRDFYYRKFRLDDEYAVVDQGNELLMSIYMTLEDLETGKRIPASLGIEKTRKSSYSGESTSRKPTSNEPTLKLNPIIGVKEPNRRSILDSVNFCFTNISLKRSPYPDIKQDMPSQNSFCYIADPDGPRPEKVFQLADYSYLGSFEDAFGRYILGIIEKLPGKIRKFIRMDPGQYACLLPHGYRMLKVEPFYCSGLHMFLRAGSVESEGEWAKTREHALRYLHRRERGDTEFRLETRGCPVIVAFLRRLRLFYYVHQRQSPPVVDTSLPYCVEIAERCMEADPSRRFIELMPGDQPVNLDNEKQREQFEGWINSFYSPSVELVEWDPFTAKHKPLESEAAPNDG